MYSIDDQFNNLNYCKMKHKTKRMALLGASMLAIGIIASASTEPGYDENGNDINECTFAPCPSGYTCLNIPGSYLCQSPDGEIIEGGTGGSEGYKIHRDDCIFEGTVDAQGYVTIFGIRKFVGLRAGAEYKEKYCNVLTDCQLNGDFLCTPYSCAEFWKDK